MTAGERPLQAAHVDALVALTLHRLLSTAQLHALRGAGASRRWTQHVLHELERRGLAAHVRAGGALKLWRVTPAGAERVRGDGRLPRTPRLLTAEEASGPLQAHTLAVNDVGVAFVRAALARGEQFGVTSWKHEVAHPLMGGRGRRRQQLIADAVLSYLLERDDRIALQYAFLELDRATLPSDRLATKLARYAQLHRLRDEGGDPPWRKWYPRFPALLVVLAGGPLDVLERRRQTALALCGSDPELVRAPEVEISIGLLAELEREGPFAPIFRQPRDPERPVDWLERAGATSGPDGGGG
jgi:hypothetical protein